MPFVVSEAVSGRSLAPGDGGWPWCLGAREGQAKQGRKRLHKASLVAAEGDSGAVRSGGSPQFLLGPPGSPVAGGEARGGGARQSPGP